MLKKLIVIIVGLVFLVAGIYMTVTGVSVIQKVGASEDWPTVTGRVTDSSVEVQRNETGTGRKKKRSTYYAPDVSYTYSVEGVPYSSNQIIYGATRYDDKSTAQAIAGQYPKGSDVTVYYDPESPDSAVLEPGIKSSSYTMLIMGIVFIVTGVITSFMGVIRRF
jgi:hypothetical protein